MKNTLQTLIIVLIAGIQIWMYTLRPDLWMPIAGTGIGLLLLLAMQFTRKEEDADTTLRTTVEQLQRQLADQTATLTGVDLQLKSSEQRHQRNDKLLQEIQQATSTKALCTQVLHLLCKELQSVQGVFYLLHTADDDARRYLKMNASYARSAADEEELLFEFGDGLVGQAAIDQATLHVPEIPEGHLQITSGTGQSGKAHLLIVPIAGAEGCIGAIEIASFIPFADNDIAFLETIVKNIAIKLEALHQA